MRPKATAPSSRRPPVPAAGPGEAAGVTRVSAFGSLRGKLLLSALVPLGVVLTAFSVMSLYVYEQVPRNIARQQNADLAVVTAARLSDGLQRHAAVLEGLAGALRAGALQGNPAGLPDLSGDALPALDVFDGGLMFCDPRGWIGWSYPQEYGRTGTAFPLPYVLEEMRGSLRPVFSDAFRDPFSREHVVLIGVPVMDGDGKLGGLMAGLCTLRHSALRAMCASVLPLRQGGASSSLVDGEGRLIYAASGGQTLSADSALAEDLPTLPPGAEGSGALFLRSPKGEVTIAAYASVPGTGWRLLTQLPWDTVIGPVRMYGGMLLAILIAGGLLSGSLIFITVGRVLRPVEDLKRGAKRVAGGDFDHAISADSGDEIEELARQFNRMAAALKESYRDLEQKVSERTRELRETQERQLQQQRELAVLEERSRMARELHDSVTQSLYSVTLFAEVARRHLEGGERERSLSSLQQLAQTAGQALREMRLLVYELRPPRLGDGGLLGALRQRLNSVEKRAGIDADLQTQGTLQLPEALELELYGIIQEALNNSLKHASAGRVQVRLELEAGSLQVEVADDGRGFDPRAAGAGGGMGLGTMRDRAAKLGGTLRLDSSPGQGTRVQFRMKARWPDGGQGG